MAPHHVDIRVPGPAGIEDHHAHLLRLDYLDRCLFFSSGNDDRAIDAHCLKLLSAQAIVIGGYVDGVQRASVEIIPDRSGQSGQAVMMIEDKYRHADISTAMMQRAQDVARNHNIMTLDMMPLGADLERVAA